MYRVILLALFIWCAVGDHAGAKPPVTRTPSGDIRGSWMQTRRGRSFQSYRGIRYAEPPVGDLRFQPPVLITKYPEPVDASEEGPACPLPVPDTYYVDEDCLRINVYTPDNNSSRRLPVIMFIHAGGFYSMTGRSDLAGPHYLLDRDVVLVTINYRIGSLGFLSMGDSLAPGNNGLKDQVAALRWVQRNIAAFGGDPELVTIAGCSAGAFSVLLHMISPMSKGLFHRAISMSGSPVSKAPTPEHTYSLAVKQAQILGCSHNSSQEIISCLKQKPWRDLGNSLPLFFEFGYDPILLWQPVVERDYGQQRFLTEDPAAAISRGRLQGVPMLVGQTTDEFFWKAFSVLKNETLLNKMNAEWDKISAVSFLLPDVNRTAARALRRAYLRGELRDDAESARGLGRLYGDAVIGFPVHRLANLMCRHSTQPVFYYEFAYIGNHSHYEDPDSKKPTGAAHHDDLIYLFTLSYMFPLIPVSATPDSDMVDRMTALWYNFARYGDPNPRDDTPELPSVQWPPMKPHERKYMSLNKEFAVKENMFEDRFKVWEELYPMTY